MLRLFCILLNNIDNIINIIYKRAVEKAVNLRLVPGLFESSFKRIAIIVRWLYFAILVILLTYIVSIGRNIENICIKLFKNLQYIGKFLIDIIIKYTGPLSQTVIDNIWLLYILLFILIILVLSIKIIKYILKYRREYNNQKTLFKTELLKKLKEQDQLIQKQLDLIKKEKNDKNNLYYIKLYNNYYTIDISKIKN